MNKLFWCIVLIFFLTYGGFARQFNPDNAKNSLVKVIVSTNNNASNALTGFVWKSPNQVVTSLHGMSRTGNIRILYQGQAWRKAKIKKVLQKADLVLLELMEGEPSPPSGVIPINQFNTSKIEFGTDVFALGYNGGATGSSSRQMKKGYVDPEKLSHLIPKKDKDALAKIGFPALDLNILYLEGSLLPGFSGAPVFDSKSQLIGIGDGGLEKGASNVSWIIPASYLTELEQSNNTTLPIGFENLTQLFSAAAVITSPSTEPASLETEKLILYESNFKSSNVAPVNAIGFEFYPTKNRSLTEMIESSDDPENLLKLSDEFELDMNIQLDYDAMRFDIYEDISNGVVVAVPEGMTLTYNPAEEAFQVINPDNNDMQLYFYGVQNDFTQTNFEDLLMSVGQIINQNFSMRYGVSGFTIDTDYSVWDEYQGGRKIAWILSLGNEYLMGQDGLQYGLYVYITLLMTEEKTFMAIATIPVPVEMVALAISTGIDCNNPGIFSEYCIYFNKMFKTFSAAHLVNFAY
ncbi:S1 family peptidase [Cyclobacterium amurskyense]|uniref:Peptidase S1 and S6 chymotrypsin/Hap n=1 Tax=Cyclobacterium amurskyense TaxID=320787 RepID=A0A0H4PGR8_9BACT|nr:serine protease [Cyclobacterium amurskyense]AKP52013.1 hypothetical protein CA2015_2602 [Cyclobacterium amurskyense]|tara:strand:+ start:2683 stop:4239 length:1557 start_codon:yes stop_codon:yes gene_type:complete